MPVYSVIDKATQVAPIYVGIQNALLGIFRSK